MDMDMDMERSRAELVADIEKKINDDVVKRFFKHIIRKDEIADLNFPDSNLPKTLATLINLGYAPDSVRETYLPGINSKQWSQFFDEDGNLRFDQILPLLVQSPKMTLPEMELYQQTVLDSWLALSSYNQENKSAEYEFVAPLLSNTLLIPKPMHPYVHHVNFFAKPKNTGSSPELFFAEVVAVGDHIGKVLRCCILTPGLYGSSSVEPFDTVGIMHPEDVSCTQCNRSSCSESDEYLNRQCNQNSGSDSDEFMWEW